MDKKSNNKLGLAIGIIVGCILGVLIIWQIIAIKQKNEDIAFLKEEISKVQSDRFKDILRFGQWKLQVEKLAKENGWALPEMSDSAVLVVDGPQFEGRISAEIEGDSVHVIDKSVKIEQ